MGQQHSSHQTSSDQAQTSYYDLLGIQKNADEDEIKKAYRRKALELHPDRNYGRVDEATTLFTNIQAAYEILSDPQERAWYDSHEDAVLAGSQGGSFHDAGIPVTTAEDLAKLYATFNGRNDFTDSTSGFFTSLRNVFDTLAKEEYLAGDHAEAILPEYPSFGSAEDHYVDVVKSFYDAWSGFTTRKTFPWKDIYRLNDAPDRRVRRAMEKENKRLRDDAVRDFNETVRMLVAFVKKRDPRVKKAQSVSDAQRQQNLREQTAAQAAKARAANMAKLDLNFEASWTRSTSDDDEQEVLWEEDDQGVTEHFECVVCDKVFKTENQYTAHERSKKHTQAVKQIRRQMRKEGRDLNLEASPRQEESAAVRTDSATTWNAQEVTVAATALDEHTSEGEGAESTREGIEHASGVANPSVQNSDDSDSTSDTEYADYAPRDIVSQRLAGVASLDLSSQEIEKKQPAERKQGKAKEKRARKAAKEAVTSKESSSLVCTGCSLDFPSKNKLFGHLQEFPDHAKVIQARGSRKQAKQTK